MMKFAAVALILWCALMDVAGFRVSQAITMIPSVVTSVIRSL